MRNLDKELIFRGVKDKAENNRTTTLRFKRDVIDFFSGDEYIDKVAVEVGTNNGESSRMLSFLFNRVHTVNINESEYARGLNSDRDNIEYHVFDAYNTFPWPIGQGDIFFIDAVHTYDAVRSDVFNCLRCESSGDKYFIFDDYGLYTEEGKGVKRCIDDLIEDGTFELIKHIGYEAGYSYTDGKTLQDWEGLIVKHHE